VESGSTTRFEGSNAGTTNLRLVSPRGGFTLLLQLLFVLVACDASIESPEARSATSIESLEVTPSSLTVHTDTRVRFEARARGVTGLSEEHEVEWMSSGPDVASTNPEGDVTPRIPGSTTILARVDRVRDSAHLVVEQAPDDTTLTTFSRHVFDDLSNGGEWSVWKDENLSIVADADAPESASNVGRAFFPAGSSGGTDLGNFMGFGFTGEGASTLYVSTWFRYSANWQGHKSGVNKMLFLLREGSASGPVYVSAQGIDDGPLEPQLRMQKSGESWSRVLKPNVDTDKKIVRGQWHRMEVRLQMNTDGRNDGTAEWWLDGVKVGSYDDVAWVPEGDPHVWSMVKFQPIWGGTKDTIEADQFLHVDQIDVKGK
jgi:hypothetical protein